jgi:hypothetical protein
MRLTADISTILPTHDMMPTDKQRFSLERTAGSWNSQEKTGLGVGGRDKPAAGGAITHKRNLSTIQHLHTNFLGLRLSTRFERELPFSQQILPILPTLKSKTAPLCRLVKFFTRCRLTLLLFRAQYASSP